MSDMGAVPESLRFLADNVGWLAHQGSADVAFDELTYAAQVAERTIRQPSEPTWFAGPCDQCGHDLYARLGAAEVECKACRLIYDVQDRRSWLLAQVDDRLERAATLSRAFVDLGLDISRQRLKMWERRGHLEAAGHDAKGRPLYRVGDVIDVFHKMSAKGTS